MNDDRFIALVERIEADGGELLLETHVAMPIIYEIPKKRGNGTRKVEVMGAGCGHEALFAIPYDVGDGDTLTQSKVKLCAICDGLDLTPRFG